MDSADLLILRLEKKQYYEKKLIQALADRLAFGATKGEERNHPLDSLGWQFFLSTTLAQALAMGTSQME